MLICGVDESGRGCEFEDAIILTNNGWKKYDQLDISTDLVMSYTQTHRMVWQPITDIVIYPIDEELIEMKHRSIHVLVTKDHHFEVLSRVMHKRKVVDYKLDRKKVTSLVANDLLPRVGTWEEQHIENFILPSIKRTKYCPKNFTEITIVMDDWLAFLGIYLAEGYCTYTKGNYIIGIAQQKPITRILIRNLLQRLPFKFRQTDRQFIIYNKQLYTYLHPLGNCYTKFIPKEYKNLSADQCNILLDWMLIGDGTVYQHGGNRNTEIRYYTSSPTLRDDFEELALKCGYGFNTIVKSFPGKTTYIRGKKITTTTENYQITLRRTKRTICKHMLATRKFVQKKGNVFCLILPEYHNFFIKRSGSGYFTGNCCLGSLIVAAVIFDTTVLETLPVKDSKKLSKKKRKEFEAEILDLAQQVVVIELTAEDINTYHRQGKTLNEMEVIAFTSALNELDVKPDEIYLDAADVLEHRFRDNVARNYKHQDIPIVAEHKADDKYPVVSAASIIAKVTRDEIMAEIAPVSGYGDKKTMAWLTEYYLENGEFPDTARYFWKTLDTIKRDIERKQLKIGF